MKSLGNIAWPVRLIQTSTTGESRFVIKDVKDEQVAVLYNTNPGVATTILKGLNAAGNYMLAQQQAPASDEVNTVKWPTWAGEYPRYGAQWGDAEIKLLRHHWTRGTSMLNIMKLLGRDKGGVEGRLSKEFGADFQEQHGLKHQQRQAIAAAAESLLTLIRQLSNP